MKGKLWWKGGLIGAANGLFGGGGGMIAVPVLERGGLPSPVAHATAIAVILPASAAGGLVYLLMGLPLFILLPVAIGVTAGGALGAKLLSRLPKGKIDFLFTLVMLAAGVRMLFP